MQANSTNTTIGILIGLLIAALIVAAVIVGVVAVLWMDTTGERGSPKSFEFDIGKHAHVDPALIRYRQTVEVSVGMKELRAVAAGPEDRICVVGDRAIHAFDAGGTKTLEITLDGQPTCLVVADTEHASPGRIYVGVGDHVETFDGSGKATGTWDGLGSDAILTSIALAEQDVFVADAGNRIVWRYDTTGRQIGRIGEPDADRHIPGFVIPSSYFDVVVTHDQLLRVVNPGARRIEAYTFDGDPMGHWGEAGPAIDRFFGCCNPSNICLLPDDRFVTAEKGLPRIKVYGISGEFESVVAGPEQLAPTGTIAVETRPDHQLKVFDVAADSRGRVLVLDPRSRCVRIFERMTDE